jgi:hypothetical protein
MIAKYQPGVPGCGYKAVASKFNVHVSSIRDWVRQKDDLLQILNGAHQQVRVRRRLDGGGRKLFMPKLEVALVDWIEGKNKMGLRVLDQYIQAKARSMHRSVELGQDKEEFDVEFEASVGWLARFKCRHALVSRRETSSRVLPPDARTVADDFIRAVTDMIQKHKIKPSNVLNMDQVPRYFETEGHSTITKKGSKNVVIRKGGSSHKRFTATFLIGMDGHIYSPHVLFSKLKNKPTVDARVFVDVNHTGMWSDVTINSWLDQILKRRVQTSFHREPVLLLLDAYGPHIKLIESRVLEKLNIFLLMVPKNMTSILQPLDVAINRSFQQYYGKAYDTYLEKAINDSSMQTKAGNVKVPSSLTVTKWVADWAEHHVSVEMIQKAFKVCGIVPSAASFDVNALHQPLRDLLTEEYNASAWNERYKELLRPEASMNLSDLGLPEYFIPMESNVGEGQAASVWQCLFREFGDTQSMSEFQTEFINEMRTIEELCDILDDAFYEELVSSDQPDAGCLLFACSCKKNVTILVINGEDMSEKTYERPSQPSRQITLIKFQDTYVIRLLCTSPSASV